MGASAISSNNLWQLDDPASFERDLERYNKYAKLDVVQQRFPEYAVLFEPGILKLQGASDERIISRIERTRQLQEQDLQNFRQRLERSASNDFDRSRASLSTIVLTDRYRDLIATYAAYDPSNNWTRVGILTDVDMTQVDNAEQ